MQLSNETILRPRFKKHLAYGAEAVLSCFENKANTVKEFKISRVDGHVFIRIPKAKQHFWSPQLHLEITEDETNGTILKGLFGPNPAVWTMFMFFHFVVAALFIASGIGLYSNMALQQPIVFALTGMITTAVAWFILYFAGRIGKKAGEKEMNLLYVFMKSTLKEVAPL